MKNNLFFVAYDYNLSKMLATKTAEFFAMRLFDSVEMFEFDHAPRKINEVVSEYGRQYVLKKMKSIIKMELDFDEAVFACNFDVLSECVDLFDDIKSKNLVIFLSDKNLENQDENLKQKKLKFLTDCCDVAIETKNLTNEKIFELVIEEIKDFFNIGG